VQCYARRKPQS